VQGLEDRGMRFMGSRNRRRWSGIYSFSGKQTEKLYEYLQEKQIIVSLRNDMIRIAPHFYNTKEEIEELIAAVAEFYG
jgi:selenocysteine lyase/cysteine desulfurase